MPTRAILLAIGAALLAAFTLACGDDDGNGDNGNGDGDGEAPPTATIPSAGLGSFTLETTEVAVGEEVRVTGADWKSTEPIVFYLATEEQALQGARAIVDGTVPEVGQATPGADGTFEFSFQLEESYQAGETTIEIESGESYRLLALQGQAAGAPIGPFTVP